MLTPLRRGPQGETSVRGEAAAPEWNEQLSFVELFPPLTRGLRLQLRDDAPLVDMAVATHVLDLRQISHPGRAGERLRPALAASAWSCPPWVPPLAANSSPAIPLRPSTQHQAVPALRGLTCRPQTTNPTLGLPLLTKFYGQPHIQ